MVSLASIADLSQLPAVDTTNDALAQIMLDAASTAIRDAAGCQISQETSTITVDALGGQRLKLPGVPVVSVASVLVDGASVTDWRLVQGGLWRRCGWGHHNSPVTVTVTYTHGFVAVPEDIKLLCCEFAAAGINAANESLEVKARLAYEGVDDYRVGFQQGADQLAGVMEIPPLTRDRLAARFGGQTFAVRA